MRDTDTIQLDFDAVEALGPAPVTPAVKTATTTATPAPSVDPATLAELNADEAATDQLPDSSVPAAYDRGHLYSPTAEVVAYNIHFRPGTQHEPMPDAPRGNPKAWGEWWRTIATAPAGDFLGLRTGDDITIQHPCSSGPGLVMKTLRFGALVRYPMPEGGDEPYAEMYVRCRSHLGHWY